VETYLLPIRQQIWKHNIETLGRVLSTPELPELTKRIKTPPIQKKQPYNSPLEKVHQEAKRRREIELEQREIIPPFVTAPWWEGSTTYIETSDEEARAKHDQVSANLENICIYTDGSSIDGHVGAAAVHPSYHKVRTAYMGPDTTSTVYAAELQGISLALEIAQTETDTDRKRNIVIFADNQAAIRSLTRPEGKSGAYIIKQIIQKIEHLQSKGHTIEVRWIPAHEGIEGNEAADSIAKEATGWRPGGTRGPKAKSPPELYALKATLKMWARNTANKMWRNSWMKDTRGRTTFRYTPVPSKKVLRLHEERSKRASALLVQMRTEKIGLRDFLFNRKVPDIADAQCSCKAGRQTVSHILLRCGKLKDLRREELGGLPGRSNLRAILSKRKLATRAINLIERAQFFGQRGTTAEQTMSSIGGRL
jgi:ribonuclease HI